MTSLCQPDLTDLSQCKSLKALHPLTHSCLSWGGAPNTPVPGTWVLGLAALCLRKRLGIFHLNMLFQFILMMGVIKVMDIGLKCWKWSIAKNNWLTTPSLIVVKFYTTPHFPKYSSLYEHSLKWYIQVEDTPQPIAERKGEVCFGGAGRGWLAWQKNESDNM